jgi:nucleotide-binding universal stress UspA family protein
LGILILVMFKAILLPLDGSSTDLKAVEQVKPLAKHAQGRVILLQVDGELEHLRQMYREFQAAGIPVELELAYGDPVVEIAKQAQQKRCDLIAMGRSRRRFLTDCIFGSITSRVQERIDLPVLLLRAEHSPSICIDVYE